MLEKDKLHIVYYINVTNIDDTDIPDFIEDIANAFADRDGSTTPLFIPTRTGDETRVEFHWPPYVPEDDRKLPDNVIEGLEERNIKYNVNCN